MQEKLLDRVVEYYDSQNWKYHREDSDDDGDSNLRMSMSVSAEEIDSVRVRTIVYDNCIATFTYFPFDIAEDKREAVIEFLTRANYGMQVGNFEMDLEDGEVRFKVHSAWDEGVIPSLSMVERYVDMGFAMMEHYGSALMKVINGDMSAREAVELAESSED